MSSPQPKFCTSVLNLRAESAAAMRADALDHVVDRAGAEADGHIDGRNRFGVKAVDPLAFFAVKMGVLVVERGVVVAVAELIFGDSAAIFEQVNDVVVGKHGQRAQNARPLQGFQRGFQLNQAHRRAGGLQCLENQNPVGRGSHSGPFKNIVYTHR